MFRRLPSVCSLLYRKFCAWSSPTATVSACVPPSTSSWLSFSSITHPSSSQTKRLSTWRLRISWKSGKYTTLVRKFNDLTSVYQILFGVTFSTYDNIFYLGRLFFQTSYLFNLKWPFSAWTTFCASNYLFPSVTFWLGVTFCTLGYLPPNLQVELDFNLVYIWYCTELCCIVLQEIQV